MTRFIYVGCVTLVLALLAAQPAGNQDVIVLANGPCDLDGTATSATGKKLNKLKNRYHAPTAADLDPEVTLAALLGPGDDLERFDDQKAAKIAGFVLDVKVGGKETCNCKATIPLDRDTHIELALSTAAPENQRVIVEITPRLRIQMKAQQVDWTTAALQHPTTGIKGKWVEVTGWLLFDSMHVNEAENTNPGDPQNWRATGWEIHPVTSLKVLAAPPPDLPNFQPQVLSAFRRPQVLQLNRNPMKKAALRMRNQALLAQFDKDELDEELPARTGPNNP